ncbi:carbohydrate kinase [Marivirga lumbricoides]|uniref:Carbohydrate kinase n=1 Tax=Marivirga lumbricoides TaxID=1046115 RepID=A0ABQ1M163_9BACT|nr:carbohydrate kinase [Marivirga lumbricoides]
MYSLGIDLGSSSIKVSLLDIEKGASAGTATYPEQELMISSPFKNWAEQDPEMWWDCFLKAFAQLIKTSGIDSKQISCVGISYQMHGLVTVDKDLKPVRPAIIWCDSRAISIGDKANKALGETFCQQHLLNSPGNFTASKLRWIRENEPEVYKSIYKIMLPGDFFALKLSGECTTTASGLSEGVFWDFESHSVSQELLEYYEIDKNLLSSVKPSFGIQCAVSNIMAEELGLTPQIPVSYRSGDQPNNAFSLNVTEPGEVAATAGTSGVIYSVTDKTLKDSKSRVNTFLHINNDEQEKRYGILLCVNGTGILNSWLKRYMTQNSLNYEEMNKQAATVPVGAEGVQIFPFGNGGERVLENKILNASFHNLDFNRHTDSHLFRAAQEGIVYALKYGFEVISEMGADSKVVKAGLANMFLSPVFQEAFVNTIGAELELYETNGAEGAARGAALGADIYKSKKETFEGLKLVKKLSPVKELTDQYTIAYNNWKNHLEILLNN